jgi:hypothetical protein
LLEVANARKIIADVTQTDASLYGLFLPPKEEGQNGQWLRDDYPLDFYNLKNDDEKTIFSSEEKIRIPVGHCFIVSFTSKKTNS